MNSQTERDRLSVIKDVGLRTHANQEREPYPRGLT